MSLEEAKEKYRQISETEDLAQKRFLMFKAFDDLLDHLEKNSVKDLKGFDGFLYKLSQDLLTSSSTYEKEQKLEKLIDRVERKYKDKDR